MTRLSAVLALLAATVFGQGTRSVLGTISAFRMESSELEVKPDNAAAQPVKFSVQTVVQKVAPGQTDLSKAETISLTDLLIGDRVLVTFDSDAAARRIVVVSADAIARDRADWTKRGVAGVVTALNGNEVTLESRSVTGLGKYNVTVSAATAFRRYPSDSMKYADAKPSSLIEVAVGDQLRARGEKSADGLKVTASEVVFGTFLSRAGNVTAINAATGEVTIKDLSNNKPLIIRFGADSKVKRLPEMAALRGMMGQGPNARDMGQAIESLPPLKPEELKTGEIVVLSAIKGTRADQVTAVTVLANAEVLVQMAMQARGAGASGPAPSLAGLAAGLSSVGP